MRLLMFLVTLLACIAFAQAADRAREQRWADEILPAVLEGDPIWLEQADGHKVLGLYTAPVEARGAVILVHGMGVHPDFGIVGALRTRLVEKGFATLSIQMPVQGKEAAPGDYVETFPEAVERISKAANWLKGKGSGKIALISHSLGGRMARSYVLADKEGGIQAWVALSLGFDDFKGVTLPVLDLYAEQDHPPVLKMVKAHKQTLIHRASEQHKLMSTGHFYDGKEAEVADRVEKWLRKTLR